MRGLGRGTALLGVGVMAGLAWSGWQVAHVYRDLDAAADATAVLQQSLASGDEARSRSSLAAASTHVDAAQERTGSTTWRVLGHLPVVGDDVRGIGVVTDVLDDLVDDGVTPVVESAGDFGALAPRESRVPLGRVERLRAPVASAAAAFARADQRLQATDDSGYVGRWQLEYRELAATVSAAAGHLAAADAAVRLLPGMLGADGPRRYLVVFQSNAEIRATGGLPGVVAVLEVDRGEIAPFTLLSGNSFAEATEAVLPLSADEEEVYGPQLGTWFLDANFTPDFARAAELWRAHWERQYGALDGVVAVDPVALSYLLEATGPVQAGPVELTADDAVPTLLNGIYASTPDPVAQDELFKTIGKAVLDQVVGGAAAPDQLLRGLARSAEEGRVLVHSFHPDEQGQITGTAVAGELVTDPDADPQLGVYLNDNTGAKMSYYLRTRVEVRGRKCTDGVQELEGTARLTSLAPPDAATSLPASVTGGGAYGVLPGVQIVAVRLYGPVGGTVSDLRLDSSPLPVEDLAVHDGRPVATTYVQLLPGASVDLSFRATTGPGQTGDTRLSVTPGIEDRDASSVVPTVCPGAGRG